MNRRTKKQKGFVRFPVNDPHYQDSKEGGMFVWAVVRDTNDTWPQCCGVAFGTMMNEELISHSTKKFFPNIDLPETNDQSVEREKWRYWSVGCLAVVALGSTGWSGFEPDKEEYWKCTRKDLTQEGLALVRSMEKLYDRKVELLTWLDT